MKSTRSIYKRLCRAIDAIDAMLLSVGCLMLFALMFLVAADVLMRYLFNSPVVWAYEVISNYLMPGLFFLAASHTLKAHSHVSVDILHNYVNRQVRYLFEALGSIAATPVFSLITFVSAQDTLENFRTGAVSASGLALPTWPVSLLLPLGFGLLSIRLALNAGGYIATILAGWEVQALPPISGTEELTS